LPESGWRNRRGLSLNKHQLFLKLIVLCAALLTVVDLTMAGGADSTDPQGMVRSAIGKAACMMRL
jgi:hypothetical protein